MTCDCNMIKATIIADYDLGSFSTYEFPDDNPSISETESSYDVEPDAHQDCVLATANKYVPKDIRIKKITTSEVTNPSGGVTAYIASEPEIGLGD